MAIPKKVREKILSIARRAREEEIRAGHHCPEQGKGACISVSTKISIALDAEHIPHEIAEGTFVGELDETRFEVPSDPSIRGHQWIRFPQYKNAILDATADQFGDFPKIWFPADPTYYEETSSTYYARRRPKATSFEIHVRGHRRRR